ncbi:MAG TPA: hypothetical protein VIL86_14245 [Tepidisphaeraceae bacterium]|jgi:hypothetical protein
MKMLFRLFVLGLLAGGWCLAAAALHVVREPSEGKIPAITIVPKNRLGFTDTYVDMRTWTVGDLQRHANLDNRLKEAGLEERVTAALEKNVEPATPGKVVITPKAAPKAAEQPKVEKPKVVDAPASEEPKRTVRSIFD